MRYDVVIVVRQQEESGWLGKTLAALGKTQPEAQGLNVIVADIRPQEAEPLNAEALNKSCGAVGGFALRRWADKTAAQARNAAAQLGEAPLIFFMAADALVEPDVFEKIYTAVQHSVIKPAALCCRVLPFETGDHIHPATQEMAVLCCEAAAVRREVFEEAGGFDERLDALAVVDFSWRVRAAGYVLRYLPAAEVTKQADMALEQPPAPTQAWQEQAMLERLLLRYKFGRPGEIWRGKKQYRAMAAQHALPQEKRRRLMQAYRGRLGRALPMFGWRMRWRGLYKERVCVWDTEPVPQRGQMKLQKPRRTPLVSIVVQTAGRTEALRETLESLRAQTYPNLEVVVVERGKDVSRLMVGQEFAEMTLRYINAGDAGHAAAGNMGLRDAKGTYICLMDDDACLYPDHVELMVAAAQKDIKAELIVAAAMALEADVVTPSPYVLEVDSIYKMEYDRLDSFLLCQRCVFPSQAVMFRRELVRRLGGLEDGAAQNGDWAMWMRYFAKARRSNARRVDVPRATSLVRLGISDNAQRDRLRAARLGAGEAAGDEVVFETSAAEMRQYYEGLLEDMRLLRQQGRLNDFLDGKLD